MLTRCTSLLTSALLVGACGSNGSEASERDAGVYAAVIEALVDELPGVDRDADDVVVFAGPLDDDVDIPLDVQAGVVDRLEDGLTVRFVDDRQEAVDTSTDLEPVRDDGVLVLLGAVPSGRFPTIRAERYLDLGDTTRYRLRAEPTDDTWSVTDVG